MPRNPRATRITLAVAGLLVAALVGVLWFSFSQREAPSPPAAEHLLSRTPTAPAATPLPAAPAPKPDAPPPPSQPLQAPVVAMGPDMILVRVIDSETRAPVTAFNVDILPHDGTPPIPRATDDIARTENSIHVSSAAGVFKTESKAGHFDLVVRAANYLPGAAEDLVVPAADAHAVEIVLSHGPSLTGLVYGEDSLPVPDVPVFLTAEKLDSPDTSKPAAALPPMVCQSGGDGRFRFSPLPPGLYSVTALEPRNDVDRLGSIVVGQGTTDVSLSLRSRHNVVVSVQDASGRAVVGAAVDLRGTQGLASGVTQESGQAHLRFLSDGTYAVSIRAAGFQDYTDELVLSGGQGEQVRWFTLQPAPAPGG